MGNLPNIPINTNNDDVIYSDPTPVNPQTNQPLPLPSTPQQPLPLQSKVQRTGQEPPVAQTPFHPGTANYIPPAEPTSPIAHHSTRAPMPSPQGPSSLEMPMIFPSKNEALYSEPKNSPEVEKSYEKVPIPEGLKTKPEASTTIILPQANALMPENTPTPPVQKIINETEKITTLHHIQDTPDDLTKKADDDEEKFITEVEKHHGHK